jgi:hypothetical protein
MKAFLREALFLCGMVTAIVCGIAAATIAVAIATNQLTGSQDWMAVAFFAAVSVAAWIAGSAAK